MAYGGNKYGGNKYGGATYGGKRFGGQKFGKSAGSTDSTDVASSDSYTPGPAPAVRGAGKVKAAPPVLSSAEAADQAPARMGGGMGGRGSAGARPNGGWGTVTRVAAAGASSGSITKPDRAAQAANKARGDAYLANNSSTDYGLGSSVNDFVKKKK